jgi:hypothetical protein
MGLIKTKKRCAMMKSGFTILLLILLTFCADKKQSNHIVFKDKDLPKIRLQSVKLDFEEFMDPRMIGRKGKFLFVMESNRTSVDVPAIHIIDTENWSYYRSKGAKGHGPYELAGANTFFPGNAPDSFWVYSAQDKKMLEYTVQDTSRLAITEYKQPEIVFKVVKISQATDSTFLGISADDPNRMIEFHRNGQRIAGYGEWEKVGTHPDVSDNGRRPGFTLVYSTGGQSLQIQGHLNYPRLYICLIWRDRGI